MAEEFSLKIFNKDFIEFFINERHKKFDKKSYSKYSEFLEFEIIDSESIGKNNENLIFATNILENTIRQIRSSYIRNIRCGLINTELGYLQSEILPYLHKKYSLLENEMNVVDGKVNEKVKSLESVFIKFLQLLLEYGTKLIKKRVEAFINKEKS